MKKILIPIFAAAVALTSCEGYLDAENIYNKDLNSFYSTPAEITQGISGCYLPMYKVYNNNNDELLLANVLDDICLGGGSSSDPSHQADLSQYVDVDTYDMAWVGAYDGIYRCNALIENLTQEGVVDKLESNFSSREAAEEFVNQAIGEAYFLRGFYYFRQGRMFGGVPIIPTTTADRNVPRSTYTETFTQAASDFKKAIDILPAKPCTAYSPAEYGHATKWAAEGYLARTYLHYTGYMTNMEGTPTETLPLNEEVGGGELTKADVVAALEDCMTNSGHKLAEDFRNIWPYTYLNECSNSQGQGDVVPYVANNNLKWIGQDGPNSNIGTGNYESMFVTRYSFGTYADHGENNNCTFMATGDVGSNANVPFGMGWGWCPVHPGLLAQWASDEPTDPRYEGSILQTGNADKATNGGGWKTSGTRSDNTGVYNIKYTQLTLKASDGSAYGMFAIVYNYLTCPSPNLAHAQDAILMRYADVLLMHTELTGNPEGLNLVRRRAGLSDKAGTLEDVKTERLYEFAFEGVRYYDLVRWGDIYKGGDATFFDDKCAIKGSNAGEYTVTPNSAAKGLLPISQNQINLSNGVYEQNPGW